MRLYINALFITALRRVKTTLYIPLLWNPCTVICLIDTSTQDDQTAIGMSLYPGWSLKENSVDKASFTSFASSFLHIAIQCP